MMGESHQPPRWNPVDKPWPWVFLVGLVFIVFWFLGSKFVQTDHCADVCAPLGFEWKAGRCYCDERKKLHE